ncbi:MAG: FAD-dependent thymidylate synthase [Spirochaetaceae bacterium]|nr:MAG: FAD-dependent thymidylate synthase [Spirochaetaceae bacterium]
MAHTVVPEAEAILDKEFPVLDKGFVRLVDYMGGDQRIVQAARVSYGEGTKSYRQDAALIDYLLRNEHTSPFEQVVLTFHTKMPVFVARQWVRHRTARLNEISGRYSVMKDEFYVPAGGDIALQSTDNKQGRQDDAVPEADQERFQQLFRDGQARAYDEYSRMLDDGIARELARINLPLSLYTEWYWQIDLHNLFRFLKLRMDAHAQKEIRAYANAMLDIAKTVCPAACAAFETHQLGSVRLSAAERAAVDALLRATLADASEGDALEQRIRRSGEAAGLSGKAVDRFADKLLRGIDG